MHIVHPKITYLHCRAGRIKVARVDPISAPRGVIQILHGFGEHVHFYMEFGSFFASHGFSCVAHDQRGFGELYVHEQGAVRRYADLLRDTGTVRRYIAEHYRGVPVYLYGHSMGGNVALNYVYRAGQNSYQKLILESPWLRKYQAIRYEALEPLARLIGSFNHCWSVQYRLKPDDITGDADKHALLDRDPFYHNRIGFRLFSLITRAGKRAIAERDGLSTPTLLLCGSRDRIISPQAVAAFYRQTGKHVRLRMYRNGYHTLHHDTVKRCVYQDMLRFITEM